MKTIHKVQHQENLEDGRSSLIANLAYNFDEMPPIIGIVTADLFGNTLMVFEYSCKAEDNYKPIKSYLSESDKNFLELDLISMYFSSFKTFAGHTNIKNLSNLEIHGSNLKVQIFFLFEKFMLILFLNSKVDLNLKEKTQIIEYFEDLLLKHEFEFNHFNASHSRKIIKSIEDRGKLWLKRLNKTSIHSFQKAFLKKHEVLDIVIKEIALIIENELGIYLEGVSGDIIQDMSKELQNKIHDKICEFKFNLD
ncbi:MAG: hypothetical protein ACW986_12675 [Promethearchaeota archaeon]|jgi:hypothetical protein